MKGLPGTPSDNSLYSKNAAILQVMKISILFLTGSFNLILLIYVISRAF